MLRALSSSSSSVSWSSEVLKCCGPNRSLSWGFPSDFEGKVRRHSPLVEDSTSDDDELCYQLEHKHILRSSWSCARYMLVILRHLPPNRRAAPPKKLMARNKNTVMVYYWKRSLETLQLQLPRRCQNCLSHKVKGGFIAWIDIVAGRSRLLMHGNLVQPQIDLSQRRSI